LVVEGTHVHFAFRLCVFVGVLYLLLPLVDVARPDSFRGYLVGERATEHVLVVLHAESLGALRAVGGYVNLVVVSVALPIALSVCIRVLVVRQVKTSPVSHMHFKTSRRKTLGLLLVGSDLVLRVAHRSVLFLRIGLDELVLSCRIVAKLLAVARNPALARVDWSLERSDHV